MQRKLPIIICFISGLIVMVTKFFTFGQGLIKTLDKWSVVSMAFAVLLGLVNLTRLHLGHVVRRREGYLYSLMLLVVMYIYMMIVLVQTPNGPTPLFTTRHITGPIGSAIYALLGFYVCSAAYRTFRCRSFEATILIVSAVILMLGQAPIGEIVFSGLPRWSNWILDVPNSAGMRGIRIGASIGGFAAAIRVLLGLERTWTGSGLSSS